MAQHHEGDDFVLGHANGCFFTQQYAQEMWLVGKRRVAQWNTRLGQANDQAHRAAPEADGVRKEKHE